MDKTKLYTIEGKTVYSVEEKFVVENYDDEYSQGANGYACWYCPENEIWLSNDLVGNEPLFILLHELWEVNKMLNDHLGYTHGHTDANRMENIARDELQGEYDCTNIAGVRIGLTKLITFAANNELADWLTGVVTTLRG